MTDSRYLAASTMVEAIDAVAQENESSVRLFLLVLGAQQPDHDALRVGRLRQVAGKPLTGRRVARVVLGAAEGGKK